MSDADMAWEAIRLDRTLTSDELRAALAAVLEVTPAAIDVGERLEALRADAVVMAAIRHEGAIAQGPSDRGSSDKGSSENGTSEEGAFDCVVDLVVEDGALGRPLDAEAIAALCRQWGCRALVDDDGDNPYCFSLITGDGPPRVVVVDPRALDERNVAVVRRPATEEDRQARPSGPVSQRRPTPPPPKSEP